MKAGLLMFSLVAFMASDDGIGAEGPPEREFVGDMDRMADEVAEILLGMHKVGSLVKAGNHESALAKAEALLWRIEQYQRRSAPSFKIYPAKRDLIGELKIWLERLCEALNRKLGPAVERITI